MYNTRRNQFNVVLLEVSHFASSVYKSTILVLRFAYDALKFWTDLPDNVCSVNSISSLRKKFTKTYSP